MQWFERIDWIQAGARIAAILIVTFVLVFIARRLIGGTGAIHGLTCA